MGKLLLSLVLDWLPTGIYWNGETGWVGPQGWWVFLAGSHLSQEGFLGPADNKVGLESTCLEAGRRGLWRRRGIGSRGTTGEPYGQWMELSLGHIKYGGLGGLGIQLAWSRGQPGHLGGKAASSVPL